MPLDQTGGREMGTGHRNRRPWLFLRRTAPVAASIVVWLGLSSVSTGTASSAATLPTPWPYTATVTSGPDAGETVHLLHLDNLTLEDLGASVVGQATLHVNLPSSAYDCLSGTSVDVFAFDGQHFLHNGLQGSQCTYGTWEIAPAVLGGPLQAPVVTAAHLVEGGSGLQPSSLAALGRNLGTAGGSISLVAYSAGSSAPVTSTTVTSWTPTRVTAATQASLTPGRLYDVLLLTSSGAAASALLTPPPRAPSAHLRPLGAPPGTKVTLTAGSPLATIGKRTVRLRAAPELRNGTLLVPVGVLAYLTGARSRWDPATRQLRLATARGEVIFQLGNRRYTLDGKVETGRAAPVLVQGVALVPVTPVARVFGLALGVQAASLPTGGATSMVITPCESCGGNGGGGGGNGGSGGSGGGQAVARTITTVYGWKGGRLVGGLSTNTSCNVPDAPSYLGGFPLGSCTAGPQSSNNPGGGVAAIGTTVFGVASGEVDQPMTLAYTSKAPAGVTATVSVEAIVDTLDMTYGISGAGGSCAPSQVNASPMQPGTDTLSTCLSTFQAVVPIGDAASVTSAALSSTNQVWSGLSNAQQACIDTPQNGVQGASCALAAANAAMSVSGTGLSVSLHQSSFTYNGTTTGGATSDFSVDPEAQVSDVGLGTEINFVTSWVLFVVTEQYTESQYAWSFPVAEVGQPLIGPWLEQCANADPLSCRLVEGSSATLTSGSVPNGMHLQSQNGVVVLAGSPTAGSEGVYQFSAQVAGGNAFDCTIDVAATLSLQELGTASTFTYETGVGFADEKAFVLPFTTTGGVGGVTWNLVGNPPWLDVASSPPTPSATGGPPVLYASGQVPTSGSYPFTLQAWDYYRSLQSQPLEVDIVPKLSLAQGSQEAQSRTPYRWGLSSLQSGGMGPYSWQVDDCPGCGALPPGISLDPATGVLSGAPSTAGSFHFVVAVTDALGVVASNEMSLVVYNLNQQPLAVEPASLPAGAVREAYSGTLEAAGAGTPPFSWKVAAGALPPGLDLAVAAYKPWYGAKAAISGTPTKAGLFSFTLRLTDGKGIAATRTFTVKIS